jgi:hypothetical protein
MRRKERPAHAEPRAPRTPRALPILLGSLLVALGAAAGVSFLMPELLVDVVPAPFDVPTAGMAAAGGAALMAVLLVASVVRGRRRTAEREFSRPQLTTVAALTPEDEVAAQQADEASPLLPEPPSLAPPVDDRSEPPVPAAVAAAPADSVPAPSATETSGNGGRRSGSGVHVFEANRTAAGGNGHGAGASPPSTPAPSGPPRAESPLAWTPRHTSDGRLLVAEAWSFGSGGSRRRRRRS